jgi:hypothetical protein
LRAFTSAKFATWPEIFFWDPNRIPTRRCAEDALNLQIQRPPRLAEKTWNDVVSRRQNYQRLSAYNINLYINHQKSWYVHVWSVCVLCIYMYNIYIYVMYVQLLILHTNQCQGAQHTLEIAGVGWDYLGMCQDSQQSGTFDGNSHTFEKAWNILEHLGTLSHIIYDHSPMQILDMIQLLRETRSKALR